MQKAEYERIYRLADTHFWYVGTRDFLRRAIRRYQPSRDLRILDAGCGPGAMMETLRHLGTVYGIDQSDEALLFLQERGFSAIKGEVEKIPFPDEFFDVVVCTEVLYHQGVEDPQRAARELLRVLKPGGIVISREPAFPFLYRDHDRVVHTARRFRRKGYVHLFESSGCRTLRSGFANFLPFLLIVGKLLLSKLRKGRITSDVEELPRLINGCLKTIVFIENRLLFLITPPIGSSVFYIGQK